jgi:hypothetical protein
MKDIKIADNGHYIIPLTKPAKGYKGALLEVIFNPVSDFPLTLTSGTVVLPDSYPFNPFVPGLQAN